MIYPKPTSEYYILQGTNTCIRSFGYGKQCGFEFMISLPYQRNEEDHGGETWRRILSTALYQAYTYIATIKDVHFQITFVDCYSILVRTLASLTTIGRLRRY